MFKAFNEMSSVYRAVLILQSSKSGLAASSGINRTLIDGAALLHFLEDSNSRVPNTWPLVWDIIFAETVIEVDDNNVWIGLLCLHI
jgi:hypothetical protein